jgi:predicted site-specific integrase-resolvase
MTDRAFFTEPEAARIVEVGPRTLRRWRKAGAVDYSLTPGGRVRYSLENLRKLQQAMRVTATIGHTKPPMA